MERDYPLEKVRNFGIIIEKEFLLPIDFQNEMFSSKQIENMEFEAKRKI